MKKALPSQYTGPGSSESKPIVIDSKAVSAIDPILPKPILEFLEVRYFHLIFFAQGRPPTKSPDQIIKKQDTTDKRTNIEENSPFQENIISEIYERSDVIFSRPS